MPEGNRQGSPGVRHIAVCAEDAGQRLDNFLLREFKGVPRSRLYRAVRGGEVRVNKGRVRADYRLVAGDVVRMPPLQQAAPGDVPVLPPRLVAELAQRILFEDDDLLVVDKPSGLAVHGGSGLSFGLIECLRQMRPQARFLELVHRLDRETSGLLLVARRRAVLRELHHMLRERQIEKSYVALAEGDWPGSLQVVEAPLEKNTLRSGERVVRVSAQGRRAITEFTVLERFPGATLLQARPLTGRTHQIRVHARHAGHPLLGDARYGGPGGASVARGAGLRRLFLHASQLRFTLAGRAPMDLHAPLDKELQNILENLRIQLK